MSKDPSDTFKEQLEKILKIDNEEVNPFGKPFRELSPGEKESVIHRLDEGAQVRAVRMARQEKRARVAKEMREKGTATVVLLAKFNGKTEKLIKARTKELGYEYAASLLNDAVEDFLGIPRGSSLPENWKENR